VQVLQSVHLTLTTNLRSKAEEHSTFPRPLVNTYHYIDTPQSLTTLSS